MSCKSYNSAVITPVLAAGSSASPYFFQVNISQKLCSPSCVDQTPVFTPVFSLEGISSVGTGQYMATIKVEGVITYVPCGGTPCCSRSQVVSQVFTIPFASATAPTQTTITAGTPVNAISASPCQQCSRSFVCEVPLTLTVTTA